MTDKSNAIFTIGHSNHRIERFLVLLAHNHIDAVADVRSMPHSRFNPQFNQVSLADTLKAAGMYYVFMGEELGARRSEPECYINGKARYDRIAQCPLFRHGLDRLREGTAKMRIALLCAERDPITCHRTILVCRHLRQPDLSISHILYDGQLESHGCLEERLMKMVQVNGKYLIHSHHDAIEYAYELQGERIAYTVNQTTEDQGESTSVD